LSAADPGMEIFRGATVGGEAWKPGSPPGDVRAAAAAAQARAGLGTNIGLAAIAADPREGLASGTVFLSANIDGSEHGSKMTLPPDRPRMREFSVISLLDLLRRALAG
jgi:nicotinamide-nucleotide amidase